MSLHLVRAGLDWLEGSFSGTLAEEKLETLARLKAQAQQREEPIPLMVAEVELFVRPKGYGYWTFVLACPEFEVCITANPKPGAAVASIRLSAFGLANSDPATLWDRAVLCLPDFGDLSPLSVSRVDVAADFQGWVPTASDMKRIVCAASYRGTHGTEAGVQTFQLGKGARVLRIYDKTAQIEAKHLDWVPDAWRCANGFDPDIPVWRAEIQYRRVALAELGIDSAQQVLADPGALMDKGLEWANLRVPDGENKTRWSEDPRWTQLRHAVFGGVPLECRHRVSELMDLERVKANMLGLVATAGAYFDEPDFMTALKRLTWAVEFRMVERDVDFAELVESKRRRIVGGTA